jgi:calcium binding protein 39
MADIGAHSTAAGPPSTAPKTPFDWLQGSLFFGGAVGGRNSRNDDEHHRAGGDTSIVAADDDSQAIDDCTDVLLLLNGIFENLNVFIREVEDSKANTIESANDMSEPKLESPITHGMETSTAPAVSSLDRIARRLAGLRFLLYDERRNTSQQHTADAFVLHRISVPAIAEATVHGISSKSLHSLIPLLLENMSLLPFESRKHVAAIFNYLLVCGLEGADAALYKSAMLQYLSYINSLYERIMTTIVQGHDLSRSGVTPDVGLHFGSMYRSCTRHPSLYCQLVGTKDRAERFVFPFLDEYVHVTNFEISSDAMESLRAAFAVPADRAAPPDSESEPNAGGKRSDIAAEFLLRDYTEIWDDRFTPKLLHDSSNYMSRRVALQILSTVLLTRSNYSVMIRYVASRTNLIVIMQLLRDTSPHITLDAFHVFKVFVANPNKPPEIIKILQDNKVKLCAYLTTLHQEKEETDTQFRDEKALVISTIEGL